MSNNLIIGRRCNLAKGFLPSFKPEIYNLSLYTSLTGTYSNVTITGKNFLPNGTTYVNFGNFTNIPVSYFGSFSISFVVPTNASIGSYNVVVVNNYNSNYSANITTIYNQNLNFSNSVTYTLI